MKVLGTFEEVRETLSLLEDEFLDKTEKLRTHVSETTNVEIKFVYDTGACHRAYYIKFCARTKVPRTIDGWEGGVWMSAGYEVGTRPDRIVNIDFERERCVKNPFLTALGFVLNDIMAETKEVTDGNDEA